MARVEYNPENDRRRVDVFPRVIDMRSPEFRQRQEEMVLRRRLAEAEAAAERLRREHETAIAEASKAVEERIATASERVKTMIATLEHVRQEENRAARNILIERSCPEWLRDFIEQMCEARKVSMLKVVMGKRDPDVIAVRDLAIYEARRRQRKGSLSKIGRYFNRDHTSIMASLARHSLRTGAPPLTESCYLERSSLLGSARP